MIIIDFETSYAARTPPGQKHHGLRSQTVPEYLHDPRTECLGAAVSIAGRRQYVTPDALSAVLDAVARLVSCGKSRLSAHNATFDLNVWARFYPESYAALRMALDAVPVRLVDTEHLARYASSQGRLPPDVGTSIAEFGRYYGIEKGDTAQAVDAGGQALAEYACRDVEIAGRVLDDLLHYWPEDENRLSALHVLCGTPGPARLMVDAEILQEVAHESPAEAALKKKLRRDDTLAAALTALGVTPIYKETATGRRKLALAKNDDFMQRLLTHDDPRVQKLAKLRQGAGSNIDRTRAQTLLKATDNGRRALPLPLPLRYYAAHTGRSGGTDKMNMQNMPRGGVHRKALMAPPGHKLVVADAAQIEVRVLAWLAGDEVTLDVFRNGQDPYKAFAVYLYQLDSEDAVTQEQRRVAKSAVLGLGYGAGMGGYIVYCKSMGIDIDEREAQRVVETYRRSRPAVPRYWRQLEREVRSTGAVQLPSGRRITYPNMTQRDFMRPKPFNKTNQPSNLWGGLIAENITQGAARDVTLVKHAVEVSQKWPVVLLVHDEIVCSVPQDDAERCLADVLGIMRTPPAWGADLPLDAEGVIVDRYGDAK